MAETFERPEVGGTPVRKGDRLQSPLGTFTVNLCCEGGLVLGDDGRVYHQSVCSRPDALSEALDGARSLADVRRAVMDAVVGPIAATLTDEQVSLLPPMWPEWDGGGTYAAGDLVAHGGATWRCVQAHPAQEGWEPGAVPALWAEVRAGQGGSGVVDAPAEWVRPTGAHDAYAKGDRVTFDGCAWESAIDANVYSPAEYPAGWAKVTD